MSKWDELTMAEKAEMMKVAVRNGITKLQDIRDKYNEFAEGGGISDEEYYSTMEKIAKDNYQKWGLSNPDEALVYALNDNTYNYRGYYNKYPQSEANADTHWNDEFKTVYHPTFSVESSYSGQKSQYNPQELYGGHWIGDRFIPTPWQIENTYSIGGPLVDWAMEKQYGSGGSIHIKKENRGKFTALKKRTGHSATWFKQHGTPAQKKMAVFELNARKWKHGLGGNLFSGEEESSQQMKTGRGHAIYLNYPNAEGALTGAVRVGGIDLGAAFGKTTGITSAPFGHAGVILVDENGNSDYYDYGRYKAGTDKHGVSTFGTIKKGKGNWRTKKLPAQKQGENDSVYVARIQGGLPDTEFGAYQAMSFPNINIEEARAYVNKQANDSNRRVYGVGNTCVDAAYRSIVPFMQDSKVREKMLESSMEEYNTEGYSPFARFWSLFPGTVGNTSAKMRKIADKTYIMNKKK